MTRTASFIEIFAASFVALGALGVTAPAHADEAEKQEYALPDTGKTGSILSFARPCGQAETECLAGDGDLSPKYPSAPANFAFGF